MIFFVSWTKISSLVIFASLKADPLQRRKLDRFPCLSGGPLLCYVQENRVVLRDVPHVVVPDGDLQRSAIISRISRAPA